LINDLKEKIICEYRKLLSKVEKGHRLDYEFILEEIMLVNLLQDGLMTCEEAMFYLEFYTTNNYDLKKANKYAL